MADKIETGKRVLFANHPNGPINEGVVKEYAPSGKYIGLQTPSGKQWARMSEFVLVEVLSDPVPEPVTGTGTAGSVSAPAEASGSVAASTEVTGGSEKTQ